MEISKKDQGNEEKREEQREEDGTQLPDNWNELARQGKDKQQLEMK